VSSGHSATLLQAYIFFCHSKLLDSLSTGLSIKSFNCLIHGSECLTFSSCLAISLQAQGEIEITDLDWEVFPILL
jgi:hypothetical protein